MNLEFFEEARLELFAAADYYEVKERGLGLRFKFEIEHVCGLIRSQPLLWRQRNEGYRQVNCPVFPYFIAYIIEQDTIYIVAVGHSSRHPDFWKKRIKP